MEDFGIGVFAAFVEAIILQPTLYWKNANKDFACDGKVFFWKLKRGNAGIRPWACYKFQHKFFCWVYFWMSTDRFTEKEKMDIFGGGKSIVHPEFRLGSSTNPGGDDIWVKDKQLKHHAPPRAGFFIAYWIAAKLKLPTAAGITNTSKASSWHLINAPCCVVSS